MCGISGFNWQDEALVSRMCDTIAHRGPDDFGLYSDQCVSLGHRRLSIIDLERGRQPLSNEDETVWIVFKGEIYNFVELRKQLVAAGHRFKTSTDTEVIIHLYEEHGTDCVQYLRGMFAFAIWDRPQRRLFLARDHVGQKPLFFHHANNRFAFASEIKALLKLDHITPEVDTAAMNHLISLRYAPGTQTLFKGIHKLPAGHRMIFESDQLRIERIDPSATGLACLGPKEPQHGCYSPAPCNWHHRSPRQYEPRCRFLKDKIIALQRDLYFDARRSKKEP